MAPKKNYTPFQMAQAVEAVRKGAKIATAAKQFGVPRVTLHDKITGKTPVECSMGPKTYLSTEEETILERWVLQMAEKHIPVSKDELLDSVQRIIVDQKRKTPFTDNRPGRKWYNLFLNRHPIISERTAQNLTTARDAVTEEDIRRWFAEVECYLREKSLLHVLQNPARIFNTDESAFFLSPKAGKVLAKKGDKHIYQSSGDEKDNLTVLITGNAAGQLAPPMVVFAYERVPSTISSQFPKGWAIGRSESGWMCGSTFYEYIANVFNPWLIQQNIQKPVVFFLDGHRSHLTLHLSNFCAKNGIEIIALHPNSTHILQPMDLAVFRPLKTFWNKAVKDWKHENLGQNLKKENFAPVLKTAMQSLSVDSIKNGFRAGGLYPFGPDYVDLTEIKSRPKPQDCSKELTLFINYLEREIVANLGSEKMKFFNELFYKGRDELNSRLNEEDTSLYIIWASNKQKVEVDLVQQDSCSQAELHDHNYANSATSYSTSNSGKKQINQTDGQEFEETTNKSITNEPNGCRITDSVPIALTSCSSTSGEEYMKFKDTTSAEPNESTNDVFIANTPSSSSQVIDPQLIPSTSSTSTAILNDDVAVETTSLKENITPKSQENSSDALMREQKNLLQLPSTSSMDIQSSAEKTPLKEIRPNTLTCVSKKIDNIYIPSPFKRNLFWPGEDDDKKGKKRKLREKVPCAITSNSWREYHEKKEEQKREKAKQKEIKAQEREEKKQLKLKEIEDKKQKRLRDKVNKKKKLNKIKTRPNDSSSDDTDIEVKYAESEDSYNMEVEEEITDIENNEKSDDSKSDDAPLSKFSKPSKTYSRGDYVIIKYEGEFFPGVIKNIRGNQFSISTMSFSMGNTFKWPEKEDKIWYQKSDIIKAIPKPVLCNKRGFYAIPEMKEYILPFAM